ncbi:condensation domain-containing protein [Actinosynnema sp. NPDC047251]|uniref:Non-ribosomal peptide synthetase-like protein n=1 Tax=Saccharothrix espanaensis (strain ATCC 51144 / DSM 44229 / JCM 9112 / NBRC 15066 / NRRL 15764) TaxID=1179773 RepID=K0K0X5_SACES|nr:condensation domain-containing protein [Saccharothrix espanaensis]CCH31192.1 Non-ribosomal peptide synthetase-like protein [Saccharothrix espanaensis DSM 44229]
MSASPVEQETTAPLSFTQEFLCMFGTDETAGPFGPRYHTVRGWRVRGRLDVDVLRAALLDVVARHETLRTVIVAEGEPHQRIHGPTAPDVRVDELGDLPAAQRHGRAEEFLNRLEGEELPVRHLPHLRVVLGRFDGEDWVVGLIAHHVAIDGWSMELLMRDLVACYPARAAGREPDLPPVPQYRKHAAWHRAHLTPAVLAEATAYWRAKLTGARMLGLPSDRPRLPDAKRVTAAHRFHVEPDLVARALSFARTHRASAFIVTMTAQNLLAHLLTGRTDIVVPTITFGRNHPDYERTVGPFFNFVPLRTDLAGCGTLRDVFDTTRRTCLEAQSHEVPFAFVLGEAPDLMATFGDPAVSVCAFQVFQYPATNVGRMGGLDYGEIRHRTRSHEVGSDIPDGTLATLEVDQEAGAFGNFRYDRAEFDPATLDRWVGSFRRLLRLVVTAPDTPLDAALREARQA